MGGDALSDCRNCHKSQSPLNIPSPNHVFDICSTFATLVKILKMCPISIRHPMMPLTPL